MKKFIKKYLCIICYAIIFIIFTIRLPYYVERPGGLIDVNDKIEVKNGYKSEGSFNLAYVAMAKVNLSVLIYAKLNRDWDIIKKQQMMAPHESDKDIEYREIKDLEEGNNTAILVAYEKAMKKIKIKDTNLYVTYVHDPKTTNLKIGDKILKVDGSIVKNKKELKKIIYGSKKEVFDFEVERKGKVLNEKVSKIIIDGEKYIGIGVAQIDEFENSDVKFKFDSKELGSSGGLMMTLAIYNYLVKEDLTKGKIIAGTGTIDMDGKVGEIGGVKHKIMGANKEKAKVFFVSKENYKEAIKVKKEKNYQMDIVKVETIDDAINYLKKMD